MNDTLLIVNGKRWLQDGGPVEWLELGPEIDDTWYDQEDE